MYSIIIIIMQVGPIPWKSLILRSIDSTAKRRRNPVFQFLCFSVPLDGNCVCITTTRLWRGPKSYIPDRLPIAKFTARELPICICYLTHSNFLTPYFHVVHCSIFIEGSISTWLLPSTTDSQMLLQPLCIKPHTS